MELRRLYYFTVLGRHLHFGRAAEEIGIAQPALSQQVKVLERELKAVLVDRGPGGVRLTPAGEVLLDGATALLSAADALGERVRTTAEGGTGILRVAYTNSGADLNIGDLVRDFRKAFPRIKVSAVTGWTAWNLELLLSGKADIAFVRGPVEQKGIRLLTLGAEESVVVLPENHPLAAQAAVSRADLADQPVVLWPRETGPAFYDRLLASVWPVGGPRLVLEEPEGEQVIAAVAGGVGVSVLDRRRARKLCPPGVVLRPFDERPPRITVSLAWRAGDRAHPVTDFVAWCRDHQLAEPAG